MLQSIVLVLHVATSLLIVGLVLLQRGKGADAGTGFGAGASGTVFGSRGSASFLSRSTAALATMFFLTSLALAFYSNQRTTPESLLERAPAGQTQPRPQVAPPPADETDLPSLEVPSGGEQGGELPDIGSGAAGDGTSPGGAGERGN